MTPCECVHDLLCRIHADFASSHVSVPSAWTKGLAAIGHAHRAVVEGQEEKRRREARLAAEELKPLVEIWKALLESRHTKNTVYLDSWKSLVFLHDRMAALCAQSDLPPEVARAHARDCDALCEKVRSAGSFAEGDLRHLQSPRKR